MFFFFADSSLRLDIDNFPYCGRAAPISGKQNDTEIPFSKKVLISIDSRIVRNKDVWSEDDFRKSLYIYIFSYSGKQTLMISGWFSQVGCYY